MKCVKGRQPPVYRVQGPSASPLPGDEVCTVVGEPCTLVECGFQAERWNAQR